MEGSEKMRTVKVLSRRSSTILSFALISFLAAIVLLQGKVRSQAAGPEKLIPINIQAIKLENPTNDPYKWPPPFLREIMLDDGRVLKVNLWGFILRATGQLFKEEGYFWIASWKFMYIAGPPKGSSSAKATFHFKFLTFERPEPSSIGEPTGGVLSTREARIHGGFYEPAGVPIWVTITWEPADKPIIVSAYCAETRRGQGYQITGGSWTGNLTVLDSGINYVVVGNPNDDVTITYSGELIWP
ncbi:MAG: hypothetical protein FGF48_00260 [Candidatus Brockarchaeota archaeon]|nr:hypothetical protein [Candidatus Brockarchaeota archaeon]